MADGTLLWFNEEKNHGRITADDGELLYVHGSAFPGGQGIVGRCKGLPVTFEVAEDDSGRYVAQVALVTLAAPRRARRRSRA
jgi:CspA family cold shock protein